MKRDNVNYFLVGLLVLVALFLLLGSLYVITGRSGPTDNYVVHYRDVSGLGFGSAVFYQGYRVGQVERIEPEQVDGKTRFRVDFSVSEGWQIPADSKAALLSSGLLADVFIGIREGESEQVLPPGAEIAARVVAEAFDYLDAPPARVFQKDVPLPYAANLEALSLPGKDDIVKAAKQVCYVE